jgi:enamine deaminase RidA (YjgF/YER057c/UK114 family)
MKTPEERITELGYKLPPPIILPKGLHLPFNFVNVRGNRVFISGHPRHSDKGEIDGPYGKVGRDLTMDQAHIAAREIALSVLSNLKHEIGELSRITGWGRVFGMVNSTPDFNEQHLVINGFSDLIIDIFGKNIGNHARSAIGVAGLPMNFAIEIEGELEIQ